MREKKNSKPKHNHIYKYRQQYFDQQCQESKNQVEKEEQLIEEPKHERDNEYKDEQG